MESEQEALKLAWSFTGLNPPNNANLEYIHTSDTGKIYLYRDEEGAWWYQTERGRKFEKEMLELQRARKKMREQERIERYVSSWKTNDYIAESDAYTIDDYRARVAGEAIGQKAGNRLDSGIAEGRAV